MPNVAKTMNAQDWALLFFLSILWGGAFFFAGVAVKELPPLTLVFARVFLAALFLLPLFFALGHRLPKRAADWTPFLVMGLLNNALPFGFIFAGQTFIASGLSSIVNAATPLFAVLILAAAGDERLTRHRLIGVLLGLLGVGVLRGIDAPIDGPQSVGIGLCLIATISYAGAGLWARRRLAGVAPLKSATLQLMSSSLIMCLAAALVDQPWTLALPSGETLLAVGGLALFGTSLAYLVFFRILVRAGPANVLLVTLLIPLTAVLLGVAFLDETLHRREIWGALLLGLALLAIDGRAPRWAHARLTKSFNRRRGEADERRV